MLFVASYLGIPVSTTHTITGCVIGAGAARRASAVRWGIARNVMIAWVITIPASATVAALFYWAVTDLSRGLIAIEIVALGGFAMFAWSEMKAQHDSYGRLAAGFGVLGFITAAVILLYGVAS
jgi:PiT family inorganic phosphate transporter